MDIINSVLHRIRVKLYPNHLKNVKGRYIARTDNDRTLDTDDICYIIKTRLNFQGKLEDLISHAHQLIEEIIYQLCDGYAVTNGYFTIYPNIGGSFDRPDETHDHDKHPVDFRFSVRAKMKRLARAIQVEVAGLAGLNGYIDSFVDLDLKSVKGLFRTGDLFIIHGGNIMIDGDDPGVGVFFVPADDPDKAVKLLRLGENGPTKITGIVPEIEDRQYRIEIRTQFCGDPKRPLKELRTITSDFTIEKD
jgi:hypothetical protein